MLKKLISFGVILLFIGLALSPSISSDIPERETVEVSIDIFGVNEINNHKINVTLEDFEKLDNLLNEIKSKISNSTSTDEANEIYNDSIVSLYELGILGELSIEDAKNLLNIEKLNPYYNKIKNSLLYKYLQNVEEPWRINLLCFVIASSHTGEEVISIGIFLAFVICYAFGHGNRPIVQMLCEFFWNYMLYLHPFLLGAIVFINGGGFMFSVGVTGIKLSSGRTFVLHGYTGLRICYGSIGEIPEPTSFYLGFSMATLS